MKISKFIFTSHIIIYIIILLFFNSCGKKNKTNDKKFFVSDSLIYNNDSNELFSGVVVDTVNDQIIKYEVKNGLKNGFFKILSLNNILLISGNIKQNKNVGEWFYYYSDGSLESKGYFANDLPDSLWYWYYPDSTLKEKGLFSKGNRVGDWFSYNEKGKLVEKRAFPDTLAKSH